MSDISIFKRYSKSQFPSPGLRSRLWSRGLSWVVFACISLLCEAFFILELCDDSH